jgi:hypothetical protein
MIACAHLMQPRLTCCRAALVPPAARSPMPTTVQKLWHAPAAHTLMMRHDRVVGRRTSTTPSSRRMHSGHGSLSGLVTDKHRI